MDIMSIGIAILVLWFVMSKRTKQSLGKFIEVSATESVEHLLITSTSAKANSLADLQEDFSERGIDLTSLAQFESQLFAAFNSNKKQKPVTATTTPIKDN